jgi:hypothetical protein
MDGIRGCARERGGVWEREECADSPVVAGFELKCPQVPAGFGEGFHQPGGEFRRGRRGKLARRGAPYKRGTGTKWEGVEEGRQKFRRRYLGWNLWTEVEEDLALTRGTHKQ